MEEELIFDIETNGFLDKMTVIHCLWIINPTTGERIGYADQPGYAPIRIGVERLKRARRLIGHNILKFDIPAINKIYPGSLPFEIDDLPRYRDTMVMARLMWPDMKQADSMRRKTPSGAALFPGKLVGSHKLEAWGYRLKCMKGEYGKDAAEGVDIWASWNLEMHTYCAQDVEVTLKLWNHILRAEPSPIAEELEHEFAFVLAKMEANGFSFNEPAAVSLYSTLVAKRAELERKLQEFFPPEVLTETFIPKVNNSKAGYVKGVPFVKKKTVVFNPSSRQQVARRLIGAGWVPQEFTPSGEPQIDDATLVGIDHPGAQALAEYFLINKRIGQIAEGDQAWLRLVRNGSIYGAINPNGAVTGRCTHSNPNIGQVPKVGKAYGAECRGLFSARKGWKLVGVDLSGLELRCLGHYMAAFDGGKYGREVVDGDIHWVNVLAMGLTEEARDDHNNSHKLYRNNGAKTFIYAFLYGCGDGKAGEVLLDLITALRAAGLPWKHLALKFFNTTETPDAETLSRAGKKLKKMFLEKTPALQRLKTAISAKLQEQVKKKIKQHLLGLDKRRLSIRSDHAALNTLLQSAGAIICKKATVLAYRYITARGWLFGRDWALVAHVHDELQIEARPDIAEEVGKLVVKAMEDAGVFFNLKLPIAGEYKIGFTWADTH